MQSPEEKLDRHSLGWAAADDVDSLLKNADPSGLLGSAARHWINRQLPVLAQEWLPLDRLRVVDVGCGDGGYADLLARAGAHGTYVGVDLFPSAHWARREAESGELSRRYVAHDAHELHTLGLRCNGAISITAFEHLRDDEVVVARIADALEPGARLIIVVPSTNGGWIWGFRHAIRWYARRDGDRLARASGMRLLLAKGTGGLPSLLLDGSRFTLASLLTRVVTAVVYLAHGWNRVRARARHPWLADLTNMIQYAHLRVAPGRALHRMMNRALFVLDRWIGVTPTQWVYVLEKPAQ